MRSHFKPYEYIPSYERRRRREWAERAFAFTLGTIVTVCLTAAFVVVLLEWSVGCGETTYYGDGTWRTNECVFINHEVKEGKWK